jgi:hypothetical protein
MIDREKYQVDTIRNAAFIESPGKKMLESCLAHIVVPAYPDIGASRDHSRNDPSLNQVESKFVFSAHLLRSIEKMGGLDKPPIIKSLSTLPYSFDPCQSVFNQIPFLQSTENNTAATLTDGTGTIYKTAYLLF